MSFLYLCYLVLYYQKEVTGLRNIIHRRDIKPDNLGRQLYQFQLRAFSTGKVYAVEKDMNPEGYTHLFRLQYITEGSATVIYNDKIYRIEKRTALYLPPGVVFEINEDPHHPLVMYFIDFEISNLIKRDDFHTLMMQCFPNFQVHDDSEFKLETLFSKIFEESVQERLGGCIIAQSLFTLLMAEMVRHSPLQKEPEPSELVKLNTTTYLVNHAISYIHQNISKKITVKEVAEQLGISEIYLYKLFKEHTGKSVQQFILDFRLKTSQYFLTNPNYSIKSIAEELGFVSAQYFSAIFKRQIGVSPTQYRAYAVKVIPGSESSQTLT